MTAGTTTLMAPSHGLDYSGDDLAQKVRALAARIHGTATQPTELWQDVIETLASAVQTVQMQEDRLLLVERAVHDTIWEWDIAEGTIRWNANVQTLLGYSLDDVGTTIAWWQEHLHADDYHRVMQKLETVLATRQEMWTDDYRLMHASGRYMSYT